MFCFPRNVLSLMLFLLTFYLYIVWKTLFSGQMLEIEFLINLHVLKSPESENHIFNVCLVCMSVCISVCQNLQIWHSTFVSLVDAVEPFYKDQKEILCTGAHKRILKH